MMPRQSTDTNLSEHEIGVLQRREQHGWVVNLIPRDALGPGLAYSFGFYEEFGHPEIIIFGLAEETMHRLINDVGKQVRSGGIPGNLPMPYCHLGSESRRPPPAGHTQVGRVPPAKR
jgi:hypothetical protein